MCKNQGNLHINPCYHNIQTFVIKLFLDSVRSQITSTQNTYTQKKPDFLKKKRTVKTIFRKKECFCKFFFQKKLFPIQNYRYILNLNCFPLATILKDSSFPLQSKNMNILKY